MRCLVTAGPTYEKLDDVRRLTNQSTGQLGTQLASHLKQQGHEVVLLIGEQATWRGERHADEVIQFSTTQDLLERLTALAKPSVTAVFHAAAVSDFTIGQVFERDDNGTLHPVNEGKVSTRSGSLMAEFVPTPKIIARLRILFPAATLVGWKFEVDGDRASVVERATQQLQDNDTDACVANGPAYGSGFGLVKRDGHEEHLVDHASLFKALQGLVANR